MSSVFTFTAETEVKKVTSTITKSEIEDHIYFLADYVLRDWETGSPELKIATSYLANSFRSYGVKPPKTGTYYLQVKLKRTFPPKDASIAINNQIITDYVILNGIAMTSRQDALFFFYGLADDYNGKEVKDKVVIVNAGGPETIDPKATFRLRRTKEKLSKDHG